MICNFMIFLEYVGSRARVSGTPILQVGNEAGEIEMTVPRGATISFLLPGSMFHRYQADDLTVPDSASVQRRIVARRLKYPFREPVPILMDRIR